MSTAKLHKRLRARPGAASQGAAKTEARPRAAPPALRDKPRSLAAGIAASLEEAIIAGRLGPRARLIELEIGATHGVSRAPVREALQMLQRDGLVVRAGRGFEVAGVSAAEAADIFEILAHLEELYTRLAAPHIGRAGLQAMRAIVDEMEAVARRDNIAAYYKLNIRFHQIIRDACPNRPLIAMMESLGKKTLRLRRIAMSISGRMPVSLIEHQRIVAALEKGDAAAAGRRARDSAEQAYAVLAAFLRTNMLE
jgi:DNA-binding GntR family transcriptional regulator